LFFYLLKRILSHLYSFFLHFVLLFFQDKTYKQQNLGLLLFANSVVPALLPFFIATEALSHTNIILKIGELFNRYMCPIFNVPGIGAYALVMGIISGYPVGAKIVTNFRNNGLCTKAEAERLLAFTNNSGPLFIIGTVGIAMFGNTEIGILLFITHLISSLLVGFLFRFWKYNDKEKTHVSKNATSSNTTISFSNLGEVLSDSILNAVHTIVIIGGFVVLFSVIISILNNCGFFNAITMILTPFFKSINISADFISPIISGIIELTNGLSSVCSISSKAISVNIIISAFLLGFGGFSVLLQVLSITSKSDISIKAYFIGKLLQGAIACILTYIVIHIFPIFNLDIVPIFSQNVDKLNTNLAYFNFYSISILAIFIVFTLFLCFKRKIKIANR